VRASLGGRLVAMSLAAAMAAGCLEHVRRAEQPAGPGLWDHGGLPTAGAGGGGQAAAGAAAADTAGRTTAGERSGPSAARPGGEPETPAARRERVRRVNEYAYWCIQQSLWNEARSHMLRALVEDSLAASLHNNLAIIYERFGAIDSAAAHYRRAMELAAEPHWYQRNLERLQRQQSAARDTTVIEPAEPGRPVPPGPLPPRLIGEEDSVR